MLKQYVQQTQLGGKDREQVLKEFSRILDEQVYMQTFLFLINYKDILLDQLVYFIYCWFNKELVFLKMVSLF